MNAFFGGCLIGLAVTIMMFFNGRLTGNSGMVAGLFTLAKDRTWWKVFYLIGLILGAFLYMMCVARPTYTLDASYPIVILAGLLVGYGTRLGGGCTSGHGICGMARLSKRSIVATLTFMAAGMVTVWGMKMIGGAL